MKKLYPIFFLIILLFIIFPTIVYSMKIKCRVQYGLPEEVTMNVYEIKESYVRGTIDKRMKIISKKNNKIFAEGNISWVQIDLGDSSIRTGLTQDTTKDLSGKKQYRIGGRGACIQL